MCCNLETFFNFTSMNNTEQTNRINQSYCPSRSLRYFTYNMSVLQPKIALIQSNIWWIIIQIETDTSNPHLSKIFQIYQLFKLRK